MKRALGIVAGWGGMLALVFCFALCAPEGWDRGVSILFGQCAVLTLITFLWGRDRMLADERKDRADEIEAVK